MRPHVERSRCWNGSKESIISQFTISHGLQGCKIKKGIALRDETKWRLIYSFSQG